VRAKAEGRDPGLWGGIESLNECRQLKPEPSAACSGELRVGDVERFPERTA